MTLPAQATGVRAQPLSDRLAAMVAARDAGQTLSEIGAVHGISRERVRQLLKVAASRLGRPIGWHCNDCGALVHGTCARRGLCPACAKRRARQHACRRCGVTFEAAGPVWAYCPACRTETRPCAACGRPITRDRGREYAYFRNTLWFCDHYCHGRHISRLYGFRPHAHVPRVVMSGLSIAVVLPATAAAHLHAPRVAVDASPDLRSLRLSPAGSTGQGTVRLAVRPNGTAVASIGRASKRLPWLRPGAPVASSVDGCDVIVRPAQDP